MPITRLILDTEMAPVSHYCHVVRAGDWVWLSGMVGMTADAISWGQRPTTKDHDRPCR